MTSEENHSIYVSACSSFSSFAHPTKPHEYYPNPTIQYSRNDFIIISNSTITELPSITSNVTHFAVNSNEQIDYAKLRYLLQNHEKKSSTTFDTSNILGSLDELSNQVRNLSQNEEMVEEKLENEIEEVIKEVETVEVKDRENVIELEQLREENEQLKLELQAFKRNTRPLFKSPSKGSKSTETRRNIFKDKLYFKLQLGKVDELETEILANLVKEIMLTLRIDDVNRVVPSLEQINKVMRVVPQLRDFIMKVILLVLDNNEEINLDISSKMLPQDIPSEQMLKKTIETLKEWRETLKDMKLYAAQLLH